MMLSQSIQPSPRFAGSYTALITPFRNGEIDEPGLRRLVEFQIEGGISGLVPCGTTGEAATMTIAEHNRVVDIVVDQASGRIPIIAGTGSNDTQCAIEHTVHAARSGADAALVVVPYYNKPTQEGMYRHFAAVAEVTELPIVLYNYRGGAASTLPRRPCCAWQKTSRPLSESRKPAAHSIRSARSRSVRRTD